MQVKFLIIGSVLMFQVAVAQNGPASLTPSQGTATTSVASASSSIAVTPTDTPSPAPSTSSETLIMDYKSVYEAPTLEDEVQMATDRFKLTKSQQDVWLTAATDRRQAEKLVRDKLDSKATDYSKDAMYRGLRSAQNTFYETVTGYLNPAQKQALEIDNVIMQEKQKRLAKLPPPPPPAPTVTVAPVDSAAIKEPQKLKGTGKKSKKPKKKS